MRLLEPRLGAADPVAGVSMRSIEAGQAARVQGSRGLEPLVDVGNVAGLVVPRVPDHAVLVDEERAPLRDVVEAAELEADPEPAHRVAVEIGQQPEVQVERLRPGDVRVRRVARDADRLDSHLVELGSPVTQELHLVRSGGRPVEEVEDEQLRPVLEQLRHRHGLVRDRGRPLRRGRDRLPASMRRDLTWRSTSGRSAPAAGRDRPRARTAGGCSRPRAPACP